MDLKGICPPGTKRALTIPVPGGEGIGAMMVEGARPGRTLVAVAGVHGCEYVGIQALRELMDELDPAQMAGRAMLIPVANAPGFFSGAKQVVPEDGKNLNRCFPGSAQGTLASRMAWALETYCYGADLLVDLHGGDVNEDMAPLVFFPVGAGERIEGLTRRAAAGLSLQYMVRSTADNGLYSYGAQRQVPALLIERGGGGRWTPEEVEACKQNVRQLLGHLAILPPQPAEDPPLEIVHTCYEQAKSQGFWICRKSPGDAVGQGELLGEVRDLYGTVTQRCAAKFDGIVLYRTHALGVGQGDPLIAYGRTGEAGSRP